MTRDTHTHTYTHSLSVCVMYEWLWMDDYVHLARGAASLSHGMMNWQQLVVEDDRPWERESEGGREGGVPWGRWWSMQLRFPVSDVRPAWIDGSAGARPARSSLPALYNSVSPCFCPHTHLVFFPTTEICHSLLCCLCWSNCSQSQLEHMCIYAAFFRGLEPRAFCTGSSV